ncbi:MAG: peptidoglycan DD-metalloendopeptidase family protein [Deltaproteobacteria bacterium]|nr:peptidoglycan DD-metalloendopeptidase family protein [Deltaproteobacteria bacterium]
MKSGRKLSLSGRLDAARSRLGVPLPATLAVGVALVGALAPTAFMPKAPAVSGTQASAPAPAPTDAELALRQSAPGPALVDLAALESAKPAAPSRLQPAPEPLVTTGVIPPRGTLAKSLQASGIRPATVQRIAREMESLLDFRAARAGDRYSLTRTPDGKLKEFSYATTSGKSYRIVSDGQHVVAETRGNDVVRRTARVAGLIKTTLYDAIQSLGESRQLATDYAEIFQWDVDFAHGIQRGDEFQILYERLYRVRTDGRETFVGPGRILAARYRGAEGDLAAVYFELEKGRGAYFRPDGSPMERAFLAAPLKYERVSSSFTYSRLHPILEIQRPHLGIDFVAAEGTPLWSIGEGVVVHRGWGGGFGNLVKIEHANGYVSFYSHLSRFAKGLSVGDRVRQKQVIGYVGSSGLATGPHVCFRVQKDGRFVNPASIRSRAIAVGSVAKREDFRTARETLLADLSSRSLVAVDEAL